MNIRDRIGTVRQGLRASREGAAGKFARGLRNRALHHAVRWALEPLEPRMLLSGALFYVNDNWHITLDTGTPGLSAGDTVDNSGAGDDGALHDLTFGTNAFGTLAGALTVAASGDRIVLVSGSYAESATIAQGVSLEGWAYFAAASSLPAGNPDPLRVNQSALNATLVTQISGAQWSVNDATAADSVWVRGMTFSGMPATGTIRALSTNQARLVVLGNSFTDSGSTGTAVRIDAGSAALPVDIENNVFTGVSSDVAANGVTGVIAGNSASGATMGITVSGGQNLTIANNTIGGLQSGVELPGVGILTDSTGAGVGVTGNVVTVGPHCDGIVVSNTGTDSVAVTANTVENGGWQSNAGIIVTNEGASFGFTSGPTRAVVSQNQVTNLEYGIALDGMGPDAAAATIAENVLHQVMNGIFMQDGAKTTIQGNQLTTGTTGIAVVAGGSALIAGNSVNDFATGILFNTGAPGTITGTRFNIGSPNTTDIRIMAGGQLVLAGGDHFGSASVFFENLSPTAFALAGEDFGTSDASVINSKIVYQFTNATYGTVTWVLAGTAVGEHVFYKGSAFDTGGGSGHDAAIAPDKSALLPGGTATFANYTSYDRGLNGLMVDLNGTVSGLTNADFVFKIGNDNSPDDWTPVEALSIAPPRALDGGITRVEIMFADGAIKNTWLQVTVLAGAHSDLLDPVVFYFGNEVGEAEGSPGDARVNAMDALMVRWGATTTADLGNHLDFNRDGKVDGADEAIALANVTWFGDELRLIMVPVPVLGSVVVADTFAGPAGTPLAAHVGEVGASWSLGGGTGNLRLDGNGGVFSAGAGAAIANAAGTMNAGTIMNLDVDINSIEPGTAIGLAFAGNSDFSSAYKLVVDENKFIQIWRILPGSATVIGSYTDSFAAGDQRHITMFYWANTDGTRIQVYVEGRIRINLKDENVGRPAGEEVGIWGTGVTTKSTGYHLCSLKIQSYPTTQIFAGDVDAAKVGPIAAMIPNTLITSADPGRRFTISAWVSLSEWTQPDPANYPHVWVAPLNLQYQEHSFGHEFVVYENGAPMAHVQSATIGSSLYAAIESAPGSFWCDTDVAVIHTSESGNPYRNGKAYNRSSSYGFDWTDSIICVMAPNCTVSHFSIDGTMRCQKDGTLPDNGYGLTDADFSTGDITIQDGLIENYGKHGLGIVRERSDSTVLVEDVEVEKGSPYCAIGGQTPFVFYMNSNAGSGNTYILRRCKTVTNSAVIGSTSGVEDPSIADFLTHNSGGVTSEFDLMSIEDCTFGSAITQGAINTKLFRITGTTYGAIHVLGNYIYNGILSVSNAVATWTPGGSSFGAMQAQLQMSGDRGATWTDVPGATSSGATVTPGYLYRVHFTDGTHEVVSNSVNEVGISGALPSPPMSVAGATAPASTGTESRTDSAAVAPPTSVDSTIAVVPEGSSVNDAGAAGLVEVEAPASLPSYETALNTETLYRPTAGTATQVDISLDLISTSVG
jgi:hypothetical protein